MPLVSETTVVVTTPTQESITLAKTTIDKAPPSVVTDLPSARVYTPVLVDSLAC